MKDSVKKVKLNRKDLEELDWGQNKPHKEKIRRRKRKYDDEEVPSKKRKENVRKREKS